VLEKGKHFLFFPWIHRQGSKPRWASEALLFPVHCSLSRKARI